MIELYSIISNTKTKMDSKGRTRRSKKSYQKRNRDIDNETNEILEGLEVEDGYVRVDENLLKRLKHTEPSDPAPPTDEDITKQLLERFPDCPEYVDMLVNGTPVTHEELSRFSNELGSNPISEMVSNLPLEYLALQRSTMKQHNFEYRYKPDIQPRVTNQYHSDPSRL